MVTRGLRARLMTAVDDHRLRAVIEQKLQRLVRQPGGIREPGQPAVGRLQQITKGQLRVIKG